MSELPLSYKRSAFILKQISAKKGSLNSLISQTNQNTNSKLVYALVIKVLQNLKIIKHIIESTNLNNETEMDSYLTEVLVCDLLYGKGLNHIKDVPQVKQILCYEKQLRKLFVKSNKFKKSEQNVEFLVRYIRINLIKTTIKKVIKRLIKNGFEHIQYNHQDMDFEEFKTKVRGLSEKQFIVDFHFPIDLLVFNINATKALETFKLYTNGKIVMQDKSSLLAVECLDVKSGATVLDVCCAPGMKSAAIASRLNNDCQLISIDINEERLNQMKQLLHKTGVTCCAMQCSDFTELSPQTFGPLDVILLDPSCSGSGMNKRLDYNKDNYTDKARLYKLAAFQTKMLCHAMAFDVKRIVYSTCSLSLIENENVVKSALNESKFAKNFQIVNVMPDWELRGKGDYDFADKCIRSDAHTYLSNGFFVCVLQSNLNK